MTRDTTEHGGTCLQMAWYTSALITLFLFFFQRDVLYIFARFCDRGVAGNAMTLSSQ